MRHPRSPARAGRRRRPVYGSRMPAETEMRQRQPISRVGYALVAISAACAAANGVVARLVIDAGVSPRELSAVRIYGASLVLAVAVLPHLRGLHRREIVQLVPFAVVGFVVGQGLYFQAISRLDIAVVLVVVFTAPLVVAMHRPQVGQHCEGEDERSTVDAHRRQLAWRDACVDHEPCDGAVRRRACRRDRHEGVADPRDGGTWPHIGCG